MQTAQEERTERRTFSLPVCDDSKAGLHVVMHLVKSRVQIPAKRNQKVRLQPNQWQTKPKALESDELTKLRDSVNSYYGLIRHTSSFKLRKHLGDKLHSLFVWPDENYTKLILPKIKK